MKHPLSPSALMRARRPYLYSDSKRRDAYRLSESEFNHHLDTITDRNQHKDFENFCRKLAERELCPNLRPQTGPEGGGDGKVDTETYPVDEQVSERWYVADAKSGAEKWGFAFSAKKAWSDKVRSDVKGIAETKRHYDRIIFITSRPARQRDRLRIEEELQNEYSVRVTILDREWIIDRVFSHGHKDLAFEQLKAGEHEPDKLKLGPNDFKRQEALEELEERLKKLGTSAPDRTQAVSDTFEAARLSRELEKPRFETDGRFQRATHYAEKYGTNYQILRAVYEHAWTAFWWFDDIDAMLERYEEIEAIAFATDHSSHISKVCNIHQLIVGRVVQGLNSADELSLSNRSGRLKDKLKELAQDKSRPNNALYAETLLIFHDMTEKLLEEDVNDFDDIWGALSGVIDRAKGLGEFPADLLETTLDVLSENMPDSAAFDELVEKLAEFMAERNKEVTAGNIYLTQGERKLDAEKPVDAIKWLGRAVVNFSKDECREEQSKALYCLSVGYRGAGLLWAARATALASLIQNLALSELESELRVETIPTLNLFATLSLQLGHVSDFLSALQFVRAIGNIAPLDSDSQQRLKDKLIEFDGLLSCLIVLLPSEEIARIEELPDILENLMLMTARLTLLYRLGHIDVLRNDGSLPEGTPDQEIHDMMKMMAAQPASKSLPKRLVLLDESFTSIHTRILGVDIEIKTENTLEGFLQAETHASALEGFAATLLNTGAFPHTEKFTIRIEQSDSLQGASVSVDDDSNVMSILLPTEWTQTGVEKSAKYNHHLIASCIHALMNIAMLPDALQTVQNLVETELAFERATLFCHAGASRNRALGAHVGRLSDWRHWIVQKYSLSNTAPHKPVTTELHPNTEKGSPDDFFADLRSHDDLVVRSVINTKLWDGAGWQGMLYGVSAPGQPPFLGLMFGNKSKAEAIFKEWHDRFERHDREDEIRISVLKGIDRENPYHYRGHITQDWNTLPKDSGKQFVNVSRMTTMTADNHRNLDMFVGHRNTCGCYFLVPAIIGASGSPELRMDLAILKHNFHVRDAWQVGAHDIDAVAVRPGDDVIVPNDEADPPVKSLHK
ncbi:hypothetical protein [Celeribacter sp.]|uniref:hypothetical protein n=1 Tax=Alphaproteobacteria TaxID=28211 RepID=UPI003A920C28